MENNHWTKKELEIYTLLLCAKADLQIDPEELTLIKSKVDHPTFEKMLEEIKDDTEDEGLHKIQRHLAWHHYSNQEIAALKREVHEVFMVDRKIRLKESSLDAILDNILY